MLKIRMMGTKSDIEWFQKLMKNHLQIRVLEISDLYANKGTDKNYRCYMEIIKKNLMKKQAGGTIAMKATGIEKLQSNKR